MTITSGTMMTNLHVANVPIDDKFLAIAMVYYTVNNGLMIDEITVDGNKYIPDDKTNVRLKKECMVDYFATKEKYDLLRKRHETGK